MTVPFRHLLLRSPRDSPPKLYSPFPPLSLLHIYPLHDRLIFIPLLEMERSSHVTNKAPSKLEALRTPEDFTCSVILIVIQVRCVRCILTSSTVGYLTCVLTASSPSPLPGRLNSVHEHSQGSHQGHLERSLSYQFFRCITISLGTEAFLRILSPLPHWLTVLCNMEDMRSVPFELPFLSCPFKAVEEYSPLPQHSTRLLSC